MARILSQTRSMLRHSLKYPPLIYLSLNRYLSFKPQLIQIDLESSSSSSSSALDMSSASSDSVNEAEALKKLEDIMHRIIVTKSTPDWLPFIPGSSFWIPPRRRSHAVVDLVSKLANELTEEESLSLATLRGWPCSSFLLQEATKADGVEVVKENGANLEVKVMVFTEIENTSRHEDEEG